MYNATTAKAVAAQVYAEQAVPEAIRTKISDSVAEGFISVTIDGAEYPLTVPILDALHALGYKVGWDEEWEEDSDWDVSWE